MDINYINNCLENNIVPECLSFKLKEKDDPIDYNKLNFLDYHEYEYYAKRFSPGFESIPGFDKYILYIAEKNKNTTPLKEMIKLKSSIE